MPDDDVTPGELRRNIQDMRQDTQRALNQMERTLEKALEALDTLPFVRTDVYDADQKTAMADQKARGERIGRIEQDVSGLKTTLTKVNFTAWTAVVIPIFTAIVIALILAAVNIGGLPK